MVHQYDVLSNQLFVGAIADIAHVVLVIMIISAVIIHDGVQAKQQLQDVSFEKEDAMAAVQKLQSVIQMVQSEMAAAQEAAERCMTQQPPAAGMLYWQGGMLLVFATNPLQYMIPTHASDPFEPTHNTPTHATQSLQSTNDAPIHAIHPLPADCDTHHLPSTHLTHACHPPFATPFMSCSFFCKF